MNLTNEQAEFAISCVEKWIQVLEDEDYHAPRSPDPSHSSLLYWLLQGNDPLPKPPPRTFSRPDHRLGQGEPRKVMAFSEHYGRVAVNHDGAYVWEDKEARLLRYTRTDELYQLEGEGEDLMIKKVHKDTFADANKKAPGSGTQGPPDKPG